MLCDMNSFQPIVNDESSSRSPRDAVDAGAVLPSMSRIAAKWWFKRVMPVLLRFLHASTSWISVRSMLLTLVACVASYCCTRLSADVIGIPVPTTPMTC